MTGDEPQSEVDVTVVGAGPVGMGLAIDLALRGHKVCVVERYRRPQRIPKGQNLTQRTGEHFRRWGVSKAIRKVSPIPPEFGNEGLTAYGSLLSGYHYDWFKRASVREFYAADNERLPQYETERVLRLRASALSGIELLFGWRFESHAEQANGVATTLVETETGETRTIRSQFLVGCDGARSQVRAAADIDETVDARGRRMALLVFRSTELDALLTERFPRKTIFNALAPELEGYWQFLGRVDLEGGWFFHAPVPDDAALETFDFTGLVHRAVGAEFALSFEHQGLWDLRFTQANDYRSGRIFIAGDAAHSHPPYGGYGVNVGFEDARNLSWKLSAWLEGWGSEALLESYSAERHPVFASTRDAFISRMIEDDARFTASFDPARDTVAFEAAWETRAGAGQAEVSGYVPNYAGSAIVWGDAQTFSGAVGEHRHRAEAGFHLSPQTLSTGPVRRAAHSDLDLFDRLGQGFTLILVGKTRGTAEHFVAAAEQLGLPLTVIKTKPTQSVRRWEAGVVLVRPDEFVAFAAKDLDGHHPAEILRRAVGA